MNQLRSDWLTVYADHRVIFTYPKFVDAVGAYLDNIGFVDLYPEPIRLYLQVRYKEPPPPMEGDLRLQRFPPLDLQVWGIPRFVDGNGKIGAKTGELHPLGKITIFCPTAHEIRIDTTCNELSPRLARDVVTTLGEQIIACIDHANAHPIATSNGKVASTPANVHDVGHLFEDSRGEQMEIVIIKKNLQDTIELVRAFAPELMWHVTTPRGVATIGNALIGASVEIEWTERLKDPNNPNAEMTRLECAALRPHQVNGYWREGLDDAARNAWGKICAEFRRRKLLQNYPDSARLANETLAQMNTRSLQAALQSGKTREEWEREYQTELAELGKKKIEDAVAEYCARFESNKAASAPKNATTLHEAEMAFLEAEREVELIKLDLAEKKENDWAEIPERFWRGHKRNLKQKLFAAERKRLEAQTRVRELQLQIIPTVPAPTEQPTWHGNGEPQTPRDVTDELDKKILALVKDNPDLTDTNIGDEIGLTRQAVNARRIKLKAMGHKVR